jgi:hypothetical protein
MISLGASFSKPTKESAPHIQWFPSKDSNAHHDLTLRPEWGFGPQVYLYFAVKDTGRGLDEEEKTKLFHRFSQASPRTHVCTPQGGWDLGMLTLPRFNMEDQALACSSRGSSRNYRAAK